MSAALMERLTPKVEHSFPVLSGESFADYAGRARVELPGRKNASRRAMLAAYTCAASKELAAEKRQKKMLWISRARLNFLPGDRRPCAVCNKYQGLAEAHHVVPLALQFDAGAQQPIQVHDWLCPTHHAAQHIFIDADLTERPASITGLPPEEAYALQLLNTRFTGLFLKLPRWESARELYRRRHAT